MARRAAPLVLAFMLALAACVAGAPPPSSPMPGGAAALPPAGYLDFCRRNPGQC